MQIELNVCQISLDELRGVVAYQREIIVKVVNQIPDALVPKVRGEFFQLYRERLSLTGTVDLEDIFSSFVHPMELLQSYGVELIDDRWFAETKTQREADNLVPIIQREYQAKRRRSKGNASARHDALLLLWILRERERTARNTWLVTLDTSLPGFLPQSENGPVRPLAITLDALLQWISPIAIHDDETVEDEAAIFSEAIKYQLLPQGSFFDLRDFIVFAEMQMSCKELPAEDVEECIRYLKANAPNLDPSDPTDR